MGKIIQSFKKEIGVALLLFTLLEVIELWTSLLHADLLDALVAFDFQTFLGWAGVLIGAFAVMLGVTYMDIRYRSYLSQKVETFLRQRMSERIGRTSYEDFHQRSSQMYVSWYTTDIAQVREQALNPSYTVARGVIGTVLSVVTLWQIHWSLVLATVLEIGVMAILPKLFSAELAQKSLVKTQANEAFTKVMTDLLASYETLFVFRKFDYFVRRAVGQSEQLGATKRAYSRSFAKVAVMGGVANVLSQVSIFLLTGYLAFIGEVSVGMIIATTSLAGTIFNAIGNASQQLAMIQSATPLFEKFESLAPTYRRGTVGEGSEEVVFQVQDVSFRYGDKRILSHFSYEFLKGHRYALMGVSGRGKSTLLNLLAGKLNPYEGKVRYCYHDISLLSYDTLYENMAYVDQHPHIYQATIRENLCFDQPTQEERIWQALEIVALSDTIRQLPERLDTMIGDQSATLSGGQLQRLAIARALLTEAHVLLLDEVTSSLDTETAVTVMKRLLEQPERTIIWVTHHLPEELRELMNEVVVL